MRRFWLSLRAPAVFILAYLLSNDLWRWFRHHHGPSMRTLPEDLLRACTVAVFYFLADYFLKRRSASKRSA
jgi:hypothetical protein